MLRCGWSTTLRVVPQHLDQWASRDRRHYDYTDRPRDCFQAVLFTSKDSDAGGRTGPAIGSGAWPTPGACAINCPVYSRPWSAARTSWSWRVRRMSTRSSRLARWPPATRWEPAFGLRRAPARWQGHRRRRPRRCGPGPRVRGGEVVRGRSGRGRPGGAEQGGALIGGDPSGDLDAVHGDVQPPFYSGNGFDTLGPPDRRPHGRAFARPEGAVFIGV